MPSRHLHVKQAITRQASCFFFYVSNYYCVRFFTLGELSDGPWSQVVGVFPLRPFNRYIRSTPLAAIAIVQHTTVC